MIKPRQLAQSLRSAARSFPAVVVTGPRQSGKTTLLRFLFGETHAYINLENQDTRRRALADPRGLFAELGNTPAIFDEIQYTPDLLSYIKSAIDERRRPGRFIITGSQHFALMRGVSESLAGRAAILSLQPFSLGEQAGVGDRLLPFGDWLKRLVAHNLPPASLHKRFSRLLWRGFYPPLARPSISPVTWYGSYVSTYLERDIRNLSQVGDLQMFEQFLRLVAARTGQILDLSNIAHDLGIAAPTAKRWLSLLETGYQILLLYPYYQNIGKRIVKRPKVYITDTGLASYLLGIQDESILTSSPQYGALFETFVVTEIWKRFLGSGNRSSMYYLRTSNGLESDVVVEWEQKLHLIEAKSTMTAMPTHGSSLIRLGRHLGSRVGSMSVISSSVSGPLGGGVWNYHWADAFLR